MHNLPIEERQDVRLDGVERQGIIEERDEHFGFPFRLVSLDGRAHNQKGMRG